METEILFPEILSFDVQIERKEVKISRAKRRRLKKKARRLLSIREDDGAVRNPVNQSTDGFSLRFDGMSLVIGVDDSVKKRKPEPFQSLDVLPVVEDEDSEIQLLDVPPVVEDEYTIKRKSVPPSEQVSPMAAVRTIMSDKSSLLPLCLPNLISTCTQASTILPSLDLFDDEGPLSSDEHCLVKTWVGGKNLKQVRDGINIESSFGLVAPRLKRKSHSKSIDGHRYYLCKRLKKD